MRVPFPLVVVLPVANERWSCLGCRLQVRVHLQTNFPMEDDSSDGNLHTIQIVC
jgi:hypothetical protein